MMNAQDKIHVHERNWQIVKAWAENRLKIHCAKLEHVTLDLQQTQVLRGRIHELRALLDLAKHSKGDAYHDAG